MTSSINQQSPSELGEVTSVRVVPLGNNKDGHHHMTIIFGHDECRKVFSRVHISREMAFDLIALLIHRGAEDARGN